MLDRSHNPWVYPAGIRERLLTPISSARLAPSLTCDIPLIDAVELRCEQGILIALSNHTLRPLDGVELKLKSDKPVTACAGCHARFDPPHARFDPPGFALESYDVIGGWRDFYQGTEGQ